MALALGVVVALAMGRTIDPDSSPATANNPRPFDAQAADAPSSGTVTAAGTSATAVAAYHIPTEHLSDWLQAASERERPLIEDGVLTFEEYQSAVQETIGCLQQAGISVVHFPGYGRGGIGEPGPRLSSRGVYSYASAVRGAPDRPPTEAAAQSAACRKGSAQIEFMWAQHTAPSEAEKQAMRNHMATCLREAGAPIPEVRPSDADLKAAKGHRVSEDTYVRCQFAAADAFEIDELPG